MTIESLSPDEHEEWSALYAIGALDPQEIQSFQKHLAAGCGICARCVREFETVTSAIALISSEEPPAELRSKVLNRIRQENSPRKTEGQPGILLQKTGLIVSRSEEIPWKSVPLPGVKIKQLFVDSARKYSTSLVSLDPGAIYPAHRHNDIEEFYLLQGDLSGEGIKMRPGDYCRSEPGTIHNEARTEAGALLLVWASRQDEFL